MLVFIELFFRKKPEEITSKDIEEFIKRRIEENLNLDYKHIKAFNDFDELSKDVSAFANSEGGLIILGIEEEKVGTDKTLKIFPKNITWGETNLSKERLEDNLIGKIHPRIDGLRIVPIRNEFKNVIFLIDIPQSENPPHMASDNKYYKRLNFEKVPMEHYEVADMFGRRRRPLLTLIPSLEGVNVEGEAKWFKMRFYLANRGKAIAKYMLFTASFFNVDILIKEGNFIRLDELRGTPSIQFSDYQNILHPHPSRRTSIGMISFTIKNKNEPIKMIYELQSEDMFPIEGELILPSQELENFAIDLEKEREILLPVKETKLTF